MLTLRKPAKLEEAVLVATAPESAVVQNRRRPGRPAQVSPHLIPILRDAANADIPPSTSAIEDAPDLAGDLAPVVGIIVASMLSLAIWTIAIGAGSWMLH